MTQNTVGKPVVTVRVESPVIVTIDKIAISEGLNRSQWMRRLITEELDRRCPSCGKRKK